VSDPSIEVRRLAPADIDAFQASMPSWNAREYAARLGYQDRGLAVQVVAWKGEMAVGRAMVVLPGHPEWSTSAFREGCPELRDVAVAADRLRRGIGRRLIEASEDAARAGVRTHRPVGRAGRRVRGARALRAVRIRLRTGLSAGGALLGDDGARMPWRACVSLSQDAGGGSVP
jgi:GNAT superfamily N-acetyltransferase